MRHSIAAFLCGLLALGISEAASAQRLSGNIDLLEYHIGGDEDLLLDGALTYGTGSNALVGKLVTDGSVGRKVDQADGQLLYSRSIGSGFNLDLGIRHEFRSRPHASYAVVGVEGEPRKGLALESYAFLSNEGDVLGAMKVVYDYPLAERLTLQPRLAVSLAAQNIPTQGLASGFTDAELGLRLRYDLTRGFAPYVGLSHKRLLGRTARLAAKAGEVVRSTHFVIGMSSAF